MNKYVTDWIYKLENLRHWNYYWYQINFINSGLEPGDRILEIGVGTRFTSNYLKSKGFQVTTMDIDPGKEPDITANIIEFDFQEHYDHVMAFEVFEHIPFEDFLSVLKKLHGICNKNVIMSVPRNEKVWLSLNIELPGSKIYTFKIATRRRKIISKFHYWEVDYKPYTRSYLESKIRESGFSVIEIKKVFSLFYYSLQKLE